MSDEYSNHPPSITEIKAERSSKSEDWTPRDALIKTLRDIDNGVRKPDSLIVMMIEQEPDDMVVPYYSAAGTLVQVMATMALVKNVYLNDMRNR